MQGHCLLTGPYNIKGRIVDTCMLSSLEVGCLRFGTHSKRAFYTLDRMYHVRSKELRAKLHVLINSRRGIELHKANSAVEAKKVINWGHTAIEGRLKYHSKMIDAIHALNLANNLPPASIYERMLQISIGGNPDFMSVGKFLPCLGQSGNPDMSVRCACGFVIEGYQHSDFKDMTRCRCGCNNH